MNMFNYVYHRNNFLKTFLFEIVGLKRTTYF